MKVLRCISKQLYCKDNTCVTGIIKIFASFRNSETMFREYREGKQGCTIQPQSLAMHPVLPLFCAYLWTSQNFRQQCPPKQFKTWPCRPVLDAITTDSMGKDYIGMEGHSHIPPLPALEHQHRVVKLTVSLQSQLSPFRSCGEPCKCSVGLSMPSRLKIAPLPCRGYNTGDHVAVFPLPLKVNGAL